MAKKKRLSDDQLLEEEFEEMANRVFPTAVSKITKAIIPLFKGLKQVIDSNEDPSLTMQGLHDFLRKNQGKDVEEISDQKAATRAIQVFAVWVSECGRSPVDLKSEIDFFIDVLLDTRKHLPTEAARDALLVRKLLRENDGDFGPIYKQMIRGYLDMTRDEQIDEELKFRARHRVNISRHKTKLKRKTTKKK
jgi:hypothetical protein